MAVDDTMWYPGRDNDTFWLRLADWGTYTIDGFYCGNRHPGTVERSDMHTLEEALVRAFQLRMSGRHPISIWQRGKCIMVLNENPGGIGKTEFAKNWNHP